MGHVCEVWKSELAKLTEPAEFIARETHAQSSSTYDNANGPVESMGAHTSRLKLIGMAYSNAQLTVARSPAAMVVLFHEPVFISSCCSQTK